MVFNEDRIWKKLIDNTDARVWAKEFAKAVKKKPDLATDEDLLYSWFAYAIMAGYDYGIGDLNRKLHWKQEKKGEY